MLMAAPTKICKTCEEEKTHDEFYASKSARDGLQSSCKACFSKRSQKRYAENKGAILARMADHRRGNVDQFISIKRTNAKQKGRHYDPAIEPFIREELGRVTHCPILGTPFAPVGSPDSTPHESVISIDRINNDLGYVLGNVRVISKMANLIKKDRDISDAQIRERWEEIQRLRENPPKPSFTGVRWEAKRLKWRVETRIDRQSVSLGYYCPGDELQAAFAHQTACALIGRKCTHDVRDQLDPETISRIEADVISRMQAKAIEINTASIKRP